MTKKSQTLVKNYKDLLTLKVKMYEMGNYNFEDCCDELKEIHEVFKKTISGLYRLSMISEKDFDELWDECYDLYWDIRNEL